MVNAGSGAALDEFDGTAASCSESERTWSTFATEWFPLA